MTGNAKCIWLARLEAIGARRQGGALWARRYALKRLAHSADEQVLLMMRNLLVALIANGAALAANPVKDAVPLFFIANHGQAPSAVRFMAKGSGLTAYTSPIPPW
jgi:hypothetical protein